MMLGTAQLGFDYGIANRGGQPPYETARDTHWTPKGAKLAAETVARHLRPLGRAPQPTLEFRTRKGRVKRYGDVLEMIQTRDTPAAFPAEEVECEQVVDDTGGLVEKEGHRAFGNLLAILELHR